MLMDYNTEESKYKYSSSIPTIYCANFTKKIDT